MGASSRRPEEALESDCPLTLSLLCSRTSIASGSPAPQPNANFPVSSANGACVTSQWIPSIVRRPCTLPSSLSRQNAMTVRLIVSLPRDVLPIPLEPRVIFSFNARRRRVIAMFRTGELNFNSKSDPSEGISEIPDLPALPSRYPIAREAFGP